MLIRHVPKRAHSESSRPAFAKVGNVGNVELQKWPVLTGHAAECQPGAFR
jgi:hypothetical protein